MITTRSRIAACAAVAAALLSASAFATTCTNGALQTSYPKCDKFPTTTPASPSPGSSSTSSSTASSNAQAGAQAAGVGVGYGGKGGAGGAGGSSSIGKVAGGSATTGPTTSSSTAAGGSSSVGPTSSTSAGGNSQQSQGLTNTSPSTSAITDTSTSTSTARSLALFIPPPVFTPPMAKIDCPIAHIKQTADAQLWSGFSQARAETDPTDCTLIQLRNAKVETCQYATAKQIEDLMVAKHLKDFKPNDGVKFTDYNEKDCAVLKAPPVEKKPEAINFLYTPPLDTRVPDVKLPVVTCQKTPAKPPRKPSSKASPPAKCEVKK